jgi:hypothetical protein
MICNNCRMKMGCGCNKRTASDGKSCCASCINAYELQLKVLKNTNPNLPGNNTIAPSNVSSSGSVFKK